MHAPGNPLHHHRQNRWARPVLAGALAILAGHSAFATHLTPTASMVRTDTAATGAGWTPIANFTVSETINGFQPVGIPDGTAAFPLNESTVRVLMNAELGSTAGYTYTLANGTALTGARVSYFDMDRTDLSIKDAGLAYDTVYDRNGDLVTTAAQINEAGHATRGFDRFCSGNGVMAGQYGFVDDIYFTCEESGTPGHVHGGSVWALDVENGALWAIPAMGRGAWENAVAFDSGSPNRVALLLGNDIEGSPLFVYIGLKNALHDNSFLDRNGLAAGSLFAWKTDNGDTTPQQFSGLVPGDMTRTGTFVPVRVLNPAMAGQSGFDAEGYLNDVTLISAATSQGAFRFSRPEDISTNPRNDQELIFASTGRGQLFPSDNWGTIYHIVMDMTQLRRPKATLAIVHHADALTVPDSGIRSPDNVVWSSDGFVYIQEDRATNPASAFGGVTGIEASVWQLNPLTGDFDRIAEIDRSVVAPAGTTDSGVGQIGHWETSGVIDVSDLFVTQPGETLLLINVQAHGITNGPIGGSANLVEGGQIIFLSHPGQTTAR